MPPVAAAVGGIASWISGAGATAIGTIGSTIGAGASALGSLASTGGTVLGGITNATIGATTGLAEYSAPILTAAKTVKEFTNIFSSDSDNQQLQTTTKTPTTVKNGSVLPTGLINTLPVILSKPQQQIMAMPTATKPAIETKTNYVPFLIIGIIAFFLLR